MRFAPHLLDDIRSRVRIHEVVGEYVIWDKRKTQPSRGDYWACCPFHGEKSPSFHAVDQRGIYHCFGCGVTGDHFKFLTEHARMSFPEAVEKVASMAGVSLPERGPRREMSQAEREAKERQDAQRRREHEAARVRAYEKEERARERKVVTARGLFAEAIPIKGTPAERYLVNRGLPPVGDWPWAPDSVLRFHEGIEYELLSEWEGDRKVRLGPILPALVCAVSDAFGDVTAIWRIFLTPEGQKANVESAKVGLGPAGGGAVRIGGDAADIGLCEGCETGLAAWFLNGCRKPVWPTLSTSGLTSFELPHFVTKVEIFPDGDRAKYRQRPTGEEFLSARPGMLAAKTKEAELVPILGRKNVSIAQEPAPGTDYLDMYNDMKAKGLI